MAEATGSSNQYYLSESDDEDFIVDDLESEFDSSFNTSENSDNDRSNDENFVDGIIFSINHI